METAAYRPLASWVNERQAAVDNRINERLGVYEMETLTLHDIKFEQAVKEYRLTGISDVLEDLVFIFDLQHLYSYYLKYNTALNAPYHNHYHVMCMMANCYEAGIHEDLSSAELRQLLIAAMFHDFDHSAGKSEDMVNIKIAMITVECLRAAGLLSHDDALVVRDIISVTQYPFVHEPVTKLQRIIRDADLMQPYEENAAVRLKQYEGLKQEIETKLQRKLTNDEFANGLKKFFKEEVVWYTEWARNKAQFRNWDYSTMSLLGQLRGDHGQQVS